MLRVVIIFLLAAGQMSCGQKAPTEVDLNYSRSGDSIPLKGMAGVLPAPFDSLRLPVGFTIDYYMQDITNARGMDLSSSGILYVGSRREGSVYAVVDEDKNGVGDKKYIIDTDLNMPCGLAFKDGNLYVSAVSKILKYENIESQLNNPPDPVVVYDAFPTEEHHGWKYIDFGPDGLLYVPVGAPCNICLSDDEIFATITRLDVQAERPTPEIVAHGVRNTVGFTWHPETKDLWFTDNGGDWLGDDLPACELNHASVMGQHYGYPYCHQGDLLDEKFGVDKSCDDYIAPAQKLGPHVAPLGMEFVTNESWPVYLKHAALIAEHGSWNRTNLIGYRISVVTFDDKGASTGYYPFIDGWLQGQERWGRPVDLEWMPDGSLLISDDFNNAIYKVQYKG